MAFILLLYLLVVASNVWRNGGFGNGQVEYLDAVHAQSLDAGRDVGLDDVDNVEEHGVVDFVDGVVGAKGAELLVDPVKDQGLAESDAKLSDEGNELVELDVAEDLDLVEVVGDAVLGHRRDGRQLVGARTDRNLLDARHKRHRPMDP